jgi:toxin YoeB
MAYWLRQDPRTARRIWELMADVKRTPFTGIGKPEPLKSWGENVWSRRINETDRLVYVVRDDRIDFLQARYHYTP